MSNIAECGSETSDYTAGCARFLDSPDDVTRPIRVRVETGYADASTVSVVKHELGHTLGLRHGDEPTDVMAARSNLTTLPQPNATERALPWDSPNLTYYVDYATVPESERAETRRQMRETFGYFADGADGTVPDNVTFARTTNRSAADVVVRFADADPCTEGSGSCGGLRGTDPDRDGALETYTRLNVTVVDIPPDARGWHVGYWTALGFGLRGEELPAPLRSEDPDVRRNDWWA
ncbi:matrixin family metalloprotease [Halosegnis marinus]|uniref:matrixin family metalloprotease n=1 Tax=Halosegnis marinus TaxID=3034023 RepID=UPI00360D1582